MDKKILYGATSLKELKIKFILSKTMREKIKSHTNKQNIARIKKTAPLAPQRVVKSSSMDQQTKRTKKHSFNCKDKIHISADCYIKSKARETSATNLSLLRLNVLRRKVYRRTFRNRSADDSKPHTTFKVVVNEVQALFDAGSDLTLIRVHNYAMIGAPPLLVKYSKFKGVY